MTPSFDGAPTLSSLTVGALLVDRATSHPDRLAIVAPRAIDGQIRELSYKQLLAESRSAAVGILQIATPGDHVALIASNVIEWTIVQYGAAIAGVLLVAVNPALSAEEIAFVLRHSDAKAVLHNRDESHSLSERINQAVADCPAIGTVRQLESLAEWGGDPEEAPDPARFPSTQAAMLQYTSGTTAQPKGVLLSHSSIVNSGQFLSGAIALPDGALAVSACANFHTAGCVAATLSPLWVAGTLVMLDRWIPSSALDEIRIRGAHWVVTVSTMLNDLVAEALEHPERAPSIATITTGAANVPRVLIENAHQLFGATVHNSYGLTEMSSVCCLVRPGADEEDFRTTLGLPLGLTECRIVDPATGRELPAGESGEIWMSGFGRMIGYYANDEANADSLRGQWFRTGDLGRKDNRGYLSFTGRLKDIIIRGGENIAPADIENCLAELSFVSQSVVVGIPDQRLGEIVAVAIQVKGDQPMTNDQLQKAVAHARLRLARFKVPQLWYAVEEFPTTASRKIQRFRLRELILAEELLPALMTGPTVRVAHAAAEH